jgi:hypothetical protein
MWENRKIDRQIERQTDRMAVRKLNNGQIDRFF